MNYSFSFKHMDASEYLEKYTRKKIREKTDKFLHRPREARVSFFTAKKEFGCHIHVTGDGYDCFVSSVSPDMYSAVNAVVVKLESQLRRRKERSRVNRNKKTKDRDVAALESASVMA